MSSSTATALAKCPFDLLVLSSSAPADSPTRPGSLTFGGRSQSNSKDFSAYQHIDLSPESAMTLKRYREMVAASAAQDLSTILSRRPDKCLCCCHQMKAAKLERSLSLTDASHSSIKLHGHFRRARRKLKQFFESINPLNGFEGKESLETYMWEQSLKVEPKDADRLDTVKPSRPANVLKSPGIKPPKALAGVSSSVGPSNYYTGYRSSGRGFSSAFNTYSTGMFNESPETPRAFVESASQMEERNTHLGMVEINPGYQPRYLGDARRGEVSPLTPLTNSTLPPPLVPRLRKEKARSGPPSPLTSSSKGKDSPSPPPLYPRRTSPQFFASPVLPPPPFKAPSAVSSTAPASPLSPPSSSAPTERAESFVFPPHCGADENRTLIAGEVASTSRVGGSNAPAVPPRRKGDALPAPLPLDAVRVVWSGEPSPRAPLVSATLPFPSAFEHIAPPLYPRHAAGMEPPPRPPKKSNQRCLTASTNTAYMESSGSESPPPPLPPKTYKRQQRRS